MARRSPMEPRKFDWKAWDFQPDRSNGLYPAGTAFPLDVNFDGVPGETLADQPDWFSLNLWQIGGRANFGSLSTGSLATDAGSLATDAGSLATDAGSLATDAGSLATDAGSLATDAGSLATDAGSLATDAGDEDYDTHIRSTVALRRRPSNAPAADSLRLTN